MSRMFRFAVAAAAVTLTVIVLGVPAWADGSIKGTVKVKVPAGFVSPVITVNKDVNFCCRESKVAGETAPCAGGKGIPDDTLQVGKDGGLAHAVVYLTKAPEGGKRDWSFLTKQLKYKVNQLDNPPTITFDQKFCRFDPHVLIVPKGWGVKVVSSDNTPHNTHSFAFKNATFNVTIAAATLNADGTVSARGELPVLAGEKYTSQAEFVKVVCDIHPWMAAVWGVMDHPYVAVTDADGNFEIDQIPAGTYQVKTYHSRFGNKHAGFKGLTVVVENGKATVVAGLAEPEAK